jgi:tetratricopeptide (TPR) repeat protein
MNVTAYTTLINQPSTISILQTEALEKVLLDFPYFQSARALRLKGLYNQNSFKYNFELKVTASYTTNRTILFDFVTSDTFIAIQKELYDKKALELLGMNVVDEELIAPPEKIETKNNTLEQSILSSIKLAFPRDLGDNLILTEEKLAIGTPLGFSKNEKHSFQEWLQLSRLQPINRDSEKTNTYVSIPKNEGKKKKEALIDKFIESSPKIPAIKHGAVSTVRVDANNGDHSSLMTETLARVYLEQKKYQKAIQAYEILILKYPEKSAFFAQYITDIKILQQNNK